MSITQVIQVAANTISGLEIADNTSFEFSEQVKPAPSQLHKVDNGMVYSYNGVINDISFEKIPVEMMPTSTQNAYQWYCDRYTKGIANSVLGTDGAGYLKTLHGTEISYEPAYKYLRSNTRPWILFSDLEYNTFRIYDAVKLYTDMASRNFAYSSYNISWVDSSGSLVVSRGNFLALPLEPGDISPSFFQADTGYKLSIAFHANQTIHLFWPAFWVGEVSNENTPSPGAIEPNRGSITQIGPERQFFAGNFL